MMAVIYNIKFIYTRKLKQQSSTPSPEKKIYPNDQVQKKQNKYPQPTSN